MYIWLVCETAHMKFSALNLWVNEEGLLDVAIIFLDCWIWQGLDWFTESMDWINLISLIKTTSPTIKQPMGCVLEPMTLNQIPASTLD